MIESIDKEKGTIQNNLAHELQHENKKNKESKREILNKIEFKAQKAKQDAAYEQNQKMQEREKQFQSIQDQLIAVQKDLHNQSVTR